LNPDVIKAVFDRYWPVLQRAFKYAHNPMTYDEILDDLLEQKAILFPLNESAALARSIPSEKGDVCQVFMGAGKMKDMKEIHTMIERWGKETGHSTMEIVGRPGWIRALQGYKVTTMTISRAI
jgi:hypothetical protein